MASASARARARRVRRREAALRVAAADAGGVAVLAVVDDAVAARTDTPRTRAYPTWHAASHAVRAAVATLRRLPRAVAADGT